MSKTPEQIAEHSARCNDPQVMIPAIAKAIREARASTVPKGHIRDELGGLWKVTDRRYDRERGSLLWTVAQPHDGGGEGEK